MSHKIDYIGQELDKMISDDDAYVVITDNEFLISATGEHALTIIALLKERFGLGVLQSLN